MMRSNFVILVSLLVAAVIVYGLVLTGSPAHQRQLRFDERRASDLSSLSFQVQSFYDRTERLPDTLADLDTGQLGSRLPSDPETGEAYEYRILGEVSYELCATFALPSQETRLGVQFEHEAGRQCFSLEVLQTKGQ